MTASNPGELNRSLSPSGWAARLSDVWDVGLIVLGSDGRIDFASARARDLLGASTDAELQDRWRDLKPNLDQTLQDARTWQATPLEIQVAAPAGGPELHLQVHLLEEPECVGYLLLLQHSDRAAAADRSLRNAARASSLMSLSRDTAHDLRDVLNVISMNVELLSRVAAHAASDAAHARHASRCAEVVRRELRRLDRSLDVLLHRNMADRDAPQVFDVNSICETLLQVIAARASRQHVEVTSNLRESSAEVKGFPDRLHGALLSVLVNALDAMPDGGRLHVGVTKARTVQIRVCDSGPGIEPDRLPDVWKLHFTTKAQGTGVGLYVTRSIVEAHGGNIYYEPNHEHGSCFIIELPQAMSH